MNRLVVFLALAVLCAGSAAEAETGTPPAEGLSSQGSALAGRPVPITISPVDRPAIMRIEGYLSSIKSIASQFSQISPSGDISAGKFYLQRPGKLRMEYNPPVPVLVVASDGSFVYYDKELQQVTNVSLDSTLVGFLARDKVKFDDSVSIVHFERGPKSLRIGIVQANKPDEGSMTLEFSDKPLVLKNIIITDSAGLSTIVSLADARFGVKLDPELFVFRDPNLAGPRHIRK